MSTKWTFPLVGVGICVANASFSFKYKMLCLQMSVWMSKYGSKKWPQNWHFERLAMCKTLIMIGVQIKSNLACTVLRTWQDFSFLFWLFSGCAPISWRNKHKVRRYSFLGNKVTMCIAAVHSNYRESAWIRSIQDICKSAKISHFWKIHEASKKTFVCVMVHVCAIECVCYLNPRC